MKTIVASFSKEKNARSTRQGRHSASTLLLPFDRTSSSYFHAFIENISLLANGNAVARDLGSREARLRGNSILHLYKIIHSARLKKQKEENVE